MAVAFNIILLSTIRRLDALATVMTAALSYLQKSAQRPLEKKQE